MTVTCIEYIYGAILNKNDIKKIASVLGIRDPYDLDPTQFEKELIRHSPELKLSLSLIPHDQDDTEDSNSLHSWAIGYHLDVVEFALVGPQKTSPFKSISPSFAQKIRDVLQTFVSKYGIILEEQDFGYILFPDDCQCCS